MPIDKDIKKVLIIGSGPIQIGQAAEFDYSGSQACKSLREEGIETVLVNSNPATIQTDMDMADTVYTEPLTPEIVSEIIKKENVDAILPTMGGQTGLNIATGLGDLGLLDGIKVLGSDIQTIKDVEDRDLFGHFMDKLNEPIPKCHAVESVEEAIEAVKDIGYPVIVRPAFTLGGTGGGVAYNEEELIEIATHGLDMSFINQVLIDESVLGWKEFEYEVMRDKEDTCIIVCNMENIDPMGIHTGESVVVAPAQNLNDRDSQALRDASIKIIRALGIQGGCNIQFAVNPETGEYKVIEVNPRVSRSSALASKATGYPIAKISSKIALGMTLDEIKNDITKETPASFEPAIDYVVVKIPRWPFDKFGGINREIGVQMKATGEVMAIGRTFEEAIQKAIRSLDMGHDGFEYVEYTEDDLANPTDERLFQLYSAIKDGMDLDKIQKLTNIDKFFLYKIRNIVNFENEVTEEKLNDADFLRKAKQMGCSNKRLAALSNQTEEYIRNLLNRFNIKQSYKMVDTCAAEFEAKTPYYYSTYDSGNELKSSNKKKIVILGAGPIRIGQGIEFDYCCVHAALALKKLGFETIIVNCNPETVSTDYDTSDKLYFEPLTLEDVLAIYKKEKPLGVIAQFGGQTPLNLAAELEKNGVKILGTSPEVIDLAEDRDLFRAMMDKLEIPMPEAGMATNVEEAVAIANQIGYPVMVRPSYVLGGRGMEVVYDDESMGDYMKAAVGVTPDRPILIDRFLNHALECEADAISDGEHAFVPAVMEHVELAGVHSGDSACIIPSVHISAENIATIKDYTRKIAEEMHVRGLMNMQYAIENGTVYVLEANPRASRTVPLVSKVCNVRMVPLATDIITSELTGRPSPVPSLKESKIPYYGVKEAAFPFNMFQEVDPILGPEMRSTGEVLGLSPSYGEAFLKAQEGVGSKLPMSGKVLISVNRKDKAEIVDVAKAFYENGFEIVATGNTYELITEAGVPAEKINKLSEGRPNVLDAITNGDFDLIINSPVGKDSINDDSYLRKAAIKTRTPYMTTVAAARAAVEGISYLKKHESCDIKSIQSLHAEIK